MKKLVVIIGPTAAKKTTLAHELSKKVNGSIINGDVFQMYKNVNVGINKPSLSSQNEIKYYLINNLSVNDSYSIFDFKKDFQKSYDDIINDGKVPIFCGGSHLYIDSIVSGYNLQSDNIQHEYNKLLVWTDKQLVDYLKTYDLETLQKTINNRHRQMRAVALLKINNNIPKKEIELQNNKSDYDTLIIMVNKDRSELYDIINKRCLEMISENKWKNEVEYLINQYGSKVKEFQSFKAIGYKEIANSILDNKEINIDSIQQKTRRLAKHQLTWCNNKFSNKIIFEYGKDDIDILVKKIKEFYND